MAETDKLLERVVKRVNDSGNPFDITITVGGAMITGRVAPRAAWLESNIEVLSGIDDTKAFVDDFANEGGASDTDEYLHLTDAKVIFGVEIPINAGTGLLRVPVSSVDSWAVGRLDINYKSPSA
ncbi:hypothetical protein ACWHLZ_27965 [Streptomyces chartreusis]|uniref:hypothetical protein n=1 Tax=Streptomyces chartreusis TaxID=1969 RepID=UPI00343B8257